MAATSVDLITARFASAKQTFIIPLTVEDVKIVADDLERISYSGDIWELRVDLLQDPQKPNDIPGLDFVIEQIRVLRRASRLPIIFTIRTIDQGGRFPNYAAEEALGLMLTAVHEQCEYIDIESTWPSSLIETVTAQKGHSSIIASHHDWSGQISWQSIYKSHYSLLDRYGDIIKLSIMLTNPAECHHMAITTEKTICEGGKPIVALGMGEAGRLSRIVGPITIVTHTMLPGVSAPDQTTLCRVHQAQHLIGQLSPKSFHIFGNRISHSLSPTIHNAAFKELGLPYRYTSFETPQIDDRVRAITLRPDFGGASVTAPHKLQIQPLLDTVTDAAKKIGAVNTVIVDETYGRKLIGDNTDWLGILALIKRSLARPAGKALVIGAGGAARAAVFALQTFGWTQVGLINRSRSTAETLAKDFPQISFDHFSSFSEASASNIMIGCIPADGILQEDIPDSMFGSGNGIVIEMSYFPVRSALMDVASQKGWQVYGGVDVLKEQAHAQFEIWTGRRAPVCVIEDALDQSAKSKI